MHSDPPQNTYLPQAQLAGKITAKCLNLKTTTSTFLQLRYGDDTVKEVEHQKKG